MIRHKIKECFKESTVLIIAHRLATVIDSDRILVMNKGIAEEYDHPFKLLASDDSDSEITINDGYFAKMVRKTGKASA